MIRRPQFTIRALLVLMLAVGCFFGGIRFERERQRQEDERAAAESLDDNPFKFDFSHLSTKK